jgi:DNA-binding MarR family transcriptional regulator/GNAT superfamily N-acetyltransferase
MPALAPKVLRDERIEAIRRFNRFYTQRIGVLDEGLLHSPFSLAEARVLYELSHRERPAATDLCRDLGLDAGYLSRILRRLLKMRLVRREPAPRDRRKSFLSLTSRGRATFAGLDMQAAEEISALLAPLPQSDRSRIAEALATVERLLGGPVARKQDRPEGHPWALRAQRPGDIGWVVERHGALYSSEYGWDDRFEGLVAKIAGAFLTRNDPGVERCFIAELHGKRVGSAFLVRASKRVARLRLLLVEPEARGMGLGKLLVEECIRFARESGYRKIVLWTQRNLLAARAIYQAAGFRKTEEERHSSFGPELVSETWELAL